MRLLEFVPNFFESICLPNERINKKNKGRKENEKNKWITLFRPPRVDYRLPPPPKNYRAPLACACATPIYTSLRLRLPPRQMTCDLPSPPLNSRKTVFSKNFVIKTHCYFFEKVRLVQEITVCLYHYQKGRTRELCINSVLSLSACSHLYF